MPQYKTELSAIYEQIKEDLRTAVGVADMTISFGFPRKEVTVLPSGTVSLLEVVTDFGNQFASAKELASGIEWAIELRLAPPEDPEDSELLAKIDVLDAFTKLVETSDGLYAGYAMWPRVSRALLELDNQLEEDQMIMQMQVSMVLTKQYGT